MTKLTTRTSPERFGALGEIINQNPFYKKKKINVGVLNTSILESTSSVL